MQLKCFHCGTPVSTEVPDGTIVRATIECPTCAGKDHLLEIRLRLARMEGQIQALLNGCKIGLECKERS